MGSKRKLNDTYRNATEKYMFSGISFGDLKIITVKSFLEKNETDSVFREKGRKKTQIDPTKKIYSFCLFFLLFF